MADRKLVYWLAYNQMAPSYSLRRRTRKEVYEAMRGGDYDDLHEYCRPHRVEERFEDTFALVETALGEGGAYWEAHCGKESVE